MNTIKDFPSANTKENKIIVLNMIITKTNEEFEYNKSHEYYGDANRKLGYMNGLIEGRDHLTFKHFLEIDDTIIWAETNLNISLGNRDYGKCDYWQSYISALGICKVIIGNKGE